jgi:2-methylcitrate dehydratase PrpD
MVAALVSSREHLGAQEAISPVMARLSSYMSEARQRLLPADVIEATKHHILDTLAAAISGSELMPGKAALKFARAYPGKGLATVVASNLTYGPIEAALANAMLAHSDETDDSHAPSLSHPGCAVVPAALAAGELFGIGGSWFLNAVALGYDIGTRVTMTMGGKDLTFAGHRSTHSIAGGFGSAAAAGCAADLNARQMRWLLDYAAQQASGVAAWQRDTDHIEKAFVFAGMPARSGLSAALLVESGHTGVDDIFSGPDNFFQANAPKSDPAGLIDKLGERYEVTRTNIKKWAVGSPIQAPLDALDILLRNHPFKAEQVQQIVVRTQGSSVVDNREMPDICLQHIVSVMVIDKNVSFQAAHDKKRMQDPAVLRLRARVQLVPDAELEERPAREGIVEVVLNDGKRLSEHVKAVRGSAQNPMIRVDVVAKCQDLIGPVLGKQTTRKLIETVLAIEKLSSVRALRAMLQPV